MPQSNGSPPPRHTEIKQILSEYSRIKGDKNRTSYWRGLVSEEDSTPMGHIFDTVDLLGSVKECLDQRVKIFTDGSGGKRTKDTRFRRCGWAWVIPEKVSEKEAKYGARGALG